MNNSINQLLAAQKHIKGLLAQQHLNSSDRRDYLALDDRINNLLLQQIQKLVDGLEDLN